MPSVNIREVDNTKAESILENKHIVLIAGPCASGSTFKEGYFSNITTFETAIGVLVGTTRTPLYDKYFVMAEECINNGLIVLYVNNAVGTGEPFIYADKYMSRFSYLNIHFVVPSDETAVAQQRAITIAATRGDAVALVDIPKEITVGETTTKYEESVQGIKHWIYDSFTNNANFTKVVQRVAVENWEGEASPTYDESVFKYVKFFAPHFTSTEYKAASEGTNLLELPAALGFLTAFGYSTVAKKNKPWFAIAGDNRGIIKVKGTITLNVTYSEADIASLQDRDTSFVELPSGGTYMNGPACNVIIDCPTGGIELYGDRTGFMNNGLVASCFGNIRILSNIIKKRMFEAGNKYKWEPNSDLMWINYTNFVNTTLDEMKSFQGIRGYEWTKYVSSKKALVRSKLTINPIEPVEDFDLTLELADELTATEE